MSAEGVTDHSGGPLAAESAAVAASAHQYGHHGPLRFVREGQSRVWTVGGMVAKTYPVDGSSPLREICAADRAFAAGVRTAACANHDMAARITWWPFIGGGQVDNPAVVANLLRQLHDTADPEGLPPARNCIPNAGTAWDFWLGELPAVLLHGDPNPTNILNPRNPTLIDWGSAGAGPRVWDVAYLAVMGEETGSATASDTLDAYGPHRDVRRGAFVEAREQIATARWRWASQQTGPMWEEEAAGRLAALRSGVFYRFPPGGHPK